MGAYKSPIVSSAFLVAPFLEILMRSMRAQGVFAQDLGTVNIAGTNRASDATEYRAVRNPAVEDTGLLVQIKAV
jgi:hypothetical protein